MEWGDPGIYLEMWDCGDWQYCDCWCPKLVERGPRGRFNCAQLRVIEEGPYHSNPEQKDWREIKEWWDSKKSEADVVQKFDWSFLED